MKLKVTPCALHFGNSPKCLFAAKDVRGMYMRPFPITNDLFTPTIKQAEVRFPSAKVKAVVVSPAKPEGTQVVEISPNVYATHAHQEIVLWLTHRMFIGLLPASARSSFKDAFDHADALRRAGYTPTLKWGTIR